MHPVPDTESEVGDQRESWSGFSWPLSVGRRSKQWLWLRLVLAGMDVGISRH